MGDSHFRSNIKGKDGTETITNFNTVSGTTVSGSVTSASSYYKVGTNKYIFPTSYSTAASIQAEATALGLGDIKGSLVLGEGQLWLFTDNTTVATVAL